MSQHPRRRARTFACAIAAVTLCAVAAPPANADIPWPYQFQPNIDGYAANQSQTTCDPTAKPGVVYFRDHLNFFFGQHYSGISRDCSVGGTSEHKEGRALDYHLNVGDPKADEILNYVLGADEHGNGHARARRFGIMYIIWNGRIISMSRISEGWRPYSGDPHTDHIHFSFGWPGARKQTSWWTTTQGSRSGTCSGKTSTVEFWHFNTGYGRLTQLKKIVDGNLVRTSDTQPEISSSYWTVRQGSTNYSPTSPLSLQNGLTPYARHVYAGATCLIPIN
jgi:hypothetical protein